MDWLCRVDTPVRLAESIPDVSVTVNFEPNLVPLYAERAGVPALH